VDRGGDAATVVDGITAATDGRSAGTCRAPGSSRPGTVRVRAPAAASPGVLRTATAGINKNRPPKTSVAGSLHQAGLV